MAVKPKYQLLHTLKVLFVGHNSGEATNNFCFYIPRWQL